MGCISPLIYPYTETEEAGGLSLAHLNSGQVSIGGVKGHGAEPLGVTEASTAPKAA